MANTSANERARLNAEPSLLSTLVQGLMQVFFVGVAVMCVYNVFGVGGEVEAMAKELACHGQPLPCSARYTSALRTPWAHTFKMYASNTSGERDVVCRREFILVGAYACQFRNSVAEPVPSAAPSGNVAPSSSVPVRVAPKSRNASKPLSQATPITSSSAAP